MRRSLTLLVIVLVVTIAPLSARRTPVPWTLSGVTLSDGGTASGSFFYDADINTYSGIAVITTAGSALGGATYVSQYPIETSSVFISLTQPPPADQTGLPVLVLSFATPLSNSGGTVNLLPAPAEGPCTDAACNSAAGLRSVIAGSVTSNAVPTMPVWGIGIMGLALLLAASWLLRGTTRAAQTA